MSIKNYIILNPSANLFKIGLILKEFNMNVYFFNTREFPLIFPDCVHIIYSNMFLTYSRKNTLDSEDNLSMFIKKDLRNKYRLKKIKKELSSIDDSLINGNISILMLYKRNALVKYNLDKSIEEIDTIKEINAKAEDIIISNTIPYLYLSKYISVYEILSVYESDFDLMESLGKDYYICFVKDEKIEFYVYNNYLCIIHKHILNPEYLIFYKFPFFKQFKFKRIEYIYLVRNHYPWIESYDQLRAVLINDYSFGGLSIRMNDLWYENVGRYLCTEKLW